MKKLLLFLLFLGFVIATFCQTNIPTSATSAASASPKSSNSYYYPDYSPFYRRTIVPVVPVQNMAAITINTSADSIEAVTQYFDPLSRPYETVIKQASPSRKDLITPKFYDEFSRQTIQYLPYAAQTGNINDGLFKGQPLSADSSFYKSLFSNEQIYYGQQNFDASPLQRVVKTTAQGNSWTGNNVGISYSQRANTAADSVRLWSINITGYTDVPTTTIVYQPGSLLVQEVTDEKGVKSVTYTDELGRKVLTKTQLSSLPSTGHAGWLCTYYVYDEMNHLRMVISPKAVAQLLTSQPQWQFSSGTISELCFSYAYDARNRLLGKSVPGAGWVYMVYDSQDRPVFMQDANMRSAGKWMYTLYDGQNRPTQTGIMVYSGIQDSLQAYATRSTNNSAPAITGTYSPRIQKDLTYNYKDPGVTNYTAGNSIVFDVGFVSTGKDSLTAMIVPSQDSTYTATVNVTNNPIPAGTTITPLTLSYYDNYSWTGRTYTNANNSKLDIGSNKYADTLPSQASQRIRGIATGMRVKVIEDPTDLTKGNWLETVLFYDEKGRNIQASSDNYKGGRDIATIRYDFTGKSVSSYLVHNNPAAAYNIRIKTNMDYDHMGRLLRVTKQLNDNDSTKRIIARNTYNELGQLLNREIGQKKYGDTSAMESQDYQFNIRGWLKGINWDYTTSSNGTKAESNKWFAMDLSYDWGFTSNQYNGNIAGMRWQSKGDITERAYGFGYDNTNRLLYADFNQKFTNTWAKTDPGNSNFTIDYTVKMGDGQNSGTAYDENGNIKMMQQQGLLLNTSSKIDSLTYTYGSNSNKLGAVNDAVTANNNLGDFSDKNTTLDDYTYDANGNLTADKNKSIASITYNHLNLPYQTSVNPSTGATGSITYIYDAAGRKLEKRLQVNSTSAAAAKTTYTTYIGGFEYLDNSLQYFATEEGRIRPSVVSGQSSMVSFSYDYFLKDHLGNIRTVLTDEQRQNIYPAATLEGSLANSTDAVNTENSYYTIDPNSIVNRSVATGITNYPNNNGIPNNNPNSNVTANSQNLYMLNGSGGGKTGLGITLRVMAGDVVDIFGKSYYFQNNANDNTSNNLPVLSVLGSLLSAPGGAISSAHGAVTAAQINPMAGTNVGGFLQNNRTPVTSATPRAYINYIILDDHFNYISGGISPVGLDTIVKDHHNDVSMQNISIPKNGYIYVYCSNESPVNVFFDNLQVVQTKGPLVEENHYYPFGLTMASISSKAANSTLNKRKFNGGTELDSDFAVNIYEAAFRGYDGQIGRFGGVDPLGELSIDLSPYSFGANDPMYWNDPSGLKEEDPWVPKNGDALHWQYGPDDESDDEGGGSYDYSSFFGSSGSSWLYEGSFSVFGTSAGVGHEAQSGGTGTPHSVYSLNTKAPRIFWEEYWYPNIEAIDYSFSNTFYGSTMTIKLPDFPNVRFLEFHYEDNVTQQDVNGRAARKANDVRNPDSRTYDLHEVPYKSTKEGGIRSIMSPALESENAGHGVSLRWFYNRNKMINGDVFYVPLYEPTIKVPFPVPTYAPGRKPNTPIPYMPIFVTTGEAAEGFEVGELLLLLLGLG